MNLSLSFILSRRVLKNTFASLYAFVKFEKKKIIFLKKLPPPKIIYVSGLTKPEPTLDTQINLSSIKGRDERYTRNEN